MADLRSVPSHIFGRRHFLKNAVKCAAAIALSRLRTWGMAVHATEVQPARTGIADPQPTAAAVAADRWIEIDLYWFERSDMLASVSALWDRIQPLFAGVEGYRGAILNVGWTVQYIMGWSGHLDQRIELPRGSGEQPWVAEEGPLTGTWDEQKRQWKERFAHPAIVPRHAYDPWTYGDLKQLAEMLRTLAANRGVSGFKVGALTYAWTNAYGEEAPWAKKHPEAFRPAQSDQEGDVFDPGPVVDPGSLLHADPLPLGGLPEGMPEGMPVHTAFAAQWGSLSKTVGLDAIMLRDSFGMPVPYRRAGPFGPLAPSFDQAERSTAAMSALVRETKLANSAALVMMYSNAASAVADWRCNCCDLESIAKEGFLDIFVDQTWAGAWNEIGVRHNDFWNSPMRGWTYQLAYLLVHAAVLADTRVRHYPLVETFDAWESWDVIHTVPERLRWGIWAYSHAAVKTPMGLKMPRGSYISWANQGKRLLSEADVQFLASNINQAVVDARRTDHVFGPTLVYSREAMSWQMRHAPRSDIKEWIDEQAGSVIKWPVPLLSSTRSEWLPQVRSDLFILQTPIHLSRKITSYLLSLSEKGHPLALFGSPEGGIDPELERLAGLHLSDVAKATPETHMAHLGPGASRYVEKVPESFPTRTRPAKVDLEAGTQALYFVDGSAALELDTRAGKALLIWNPPDFSQEEANPLRNLWGGSPAAPAIAAGALNFLISTPASLHAAAVDMNQTMNICAWNSADGGIHLLAADLEEGLRDDADMSRHATLVLPQSWKVERLNDEWSKRVISVHDSRLRVDLNQADSVLLVAQSKT